jgi:hypothetical protein
MRYVELLESGSRGLFVRCQEAAAGKKIVFKSQEGKTITAIGVAVLPEKFAFYENDTINDLPINARSLPPFEQKKLLKTGQQKLMDSLEQYRLTAKITNNNWNIVNSNGRSALITLWTNNRNQLIAYVKLFQQKSLSAIPFFWSNSDFSKDTGFSIENVSQLKAALNLKPSTVVGVDARFSIDDLLEQVSINIVEHTELPAEVIKQVPQLLRNVQSGFSEPTANAAQYIKSYEVDLGETAAPIAFMTGHFVSGAYKQVEDQLLKPLGSSWKKIKTCSFPMAGNEQLVDSYLNINASTKIGISSKDSGGGAAASVTSLSSVIEKNPERFKDLLNKKKYKYLFNVINLIKEKSAVEGPLELGVLYGIIDRADQIKILEATNDPHLIKSDVTKKLQKLLNNPIYKPNTKSPNYMIGYHLLTAVANLVTEHLNEQEDTVTAFFKEILSRSNMVQCKTIMKSTGSAAAFIDFNIIWPPVFEGKVKFQSQKNYGSGKPGGKICFKIG